MQNKSKATVIDDLLAGMTLEQKVGQCLVIGFTGTMITPTIIERIKRYCPAGIRTGLTFRVKSALHDPYATSEAFAERVLRAPKGAVKDYLPNRPVPCCTNTEYCQFLNTLKQAALDNDLGIPLHITFDMEGDASADYFQGGIKFFPNPAGITQSGDLEMAYQVGWATGRQVVPLGYNWIHSPILDVNTEPRNPEIGTRSYSADPDIVAKLGAETVRGLTASGLISTGKHFPGRGASLGDAHHGLPTIDISRRDLEKHLVPFHALIEAGLPAIMSAHTAYPSLDPSGRSASLSKPILTDLLKGEMGFKGVVTTDDITMGGIIERFEVVDACIEAINAGNDLILFRDESPLIDEVFPQLVEAARSGRLPEARLDDAIRRTLGVKYDFKILEKGNQQEVSKAAEGISDPRVESIAAESAQAAIHVLRDEANLLPLSPASSVLLVEQINPLHNWVNNQRCHPSILWEHLLQYSDKVCQVETTMSFDEDDQKRVLARLNEADVIVTTNYYYRRATGGNEFIRKLHETGKPIVVVTNSPYPLTVLPEYKTVIVTYGASPESMACVAKTLFKP